MPIEIRELNIRVNISENAGGNPGSNSSPDSTTQGFGHGTSDKAAIVQEAVEKVLEILKTNSER